MEFDQMTTQFLQQFRGFGIFELMWSVSELGRAPLVFAIVSGIVVFLYLRRLRWEALVLLASTGGVSFFGWWLKYLIGRPRPEIGQAEIFKANLDPSFPSGHVLLYTVFFGFLFFLAGHKIKSHFWKTFWQVFLGGFIVLIGPSRIYLGEHWLTDTLAAYLLGVIWLVGTIMVYRLKQLRNLFF